MSPYTPARGQGCPGQTDSCKPLRKTGPRPVSYTEHLRAGDKQPHNLSTITTINPVHVLHQQHGTAITDSHRKLKTSSVTGGSVGQMPDQLPQTEVRPLLLLPTTWKPLSVELVVEVSGPISMVTPRWYVLSSPLPSRMYRRVFQGLQVM